MALGVDECSIPPAGGSWRVRDVSWRRVLTQQDFGAILGSLAAILALAIAQGLLDGPATRQFMVTDATISYPNGDSTVPYWLACTVSAATMALSVLLCELVLARHLHADLTDALAATLHFVFDGIAAFLVAGLGTTVVKMCVGRLRPDFLDRCQPAIPSPLDVQYGLPAADNPACQAPTSSELTDGHYSFPSGHTSTVFVFAIWTAAYCTWAFYQRLPSRSAVEVRSQPLRQRLAGDVATAGGFLWILAVLSWATYVGVSRIIDYKHHPSDVVAGAFLGTVVGLLFAARAVLRVGRVLVGSAAAGCSGSGGSTPLLSNAPDAPHPLLPSNRVYGQSDTVRVSPV